MAGNPFQHIDMRVVDKGEALRFYSRLLPAVGFTRDEGGKFFHCFSAEGTPPSQPWFGFTEDPGHRPNANRIAFQAASRADVDRVAEIARRAGAGNMSGPKLPVSKHCVLTDFDTVLCTGSGLTLSGGPAFCGAGVEARRAHVHAS